MLNTFMIFVSIIAGSNLYSHLVFITSSVFDIPSSFTSSLVTIT